MHRAGQRHSAREELRDDRTDYLSGRTVVSASEHIEFSVRKQPRDLRSSVTEETWASVTGKQKGRDVDGPNRLLRDRGTSVGVVHHFEDVQHGRCYRLHSGILAQFFSHFPRQAGGREEYRDCVSSAVLRDRSPDVLGEFARSLLAVLVIGSVRRLK